MKRSLTLAVVLLCCFSVFTSCEKDEAPISFLTVDLTRAAEGEWVFATNEKGELLDIVRVDLTNKGIRQFKTTKRFSSIDVSFLSAYRTDQGFFAYYGSTYRNVPSSQTVDAGYPVENGFGNSTPLGSIQLTVNNYPGSLKDVWMNTGRGPVSPDDITLTAQRITANFEVFEKSKWLLIASMRDGVPVYYRHELQAGNTSAEVHFNSFAPMENTQTLSLKGPATVSGIAASGSLMPITFLYHYNYEDGSPIAIGTVPGFPRYITLLSKTEQTYCKVGAPIAASENVEAKFINYTLDATDRNLKTFTFNFSDAYDYKRASASTGDGSVAGSWGVYASADDEARMLFDFPSEILNEFPEMRNAEWREGSISIYKSLNGSRTYSDFLNSELSFIYKSEYEQLIINR
jgi:hypothetical protein